MCPSELFAQNRDEGTKQGNLKKPRFGLMPEIVPDDLKGFTRIFDGKSLSGWDGNTDFWKVENQTIVGESTPQKVVKENNFLIWRGGTVADFELKVEFRLNGVNSGIQYRSTELTNEGKWILKGYQADIDFRLFHAGNIHEERGRIGHVILAQRGSVTRVVKGPIFKSIAEIDNSKELRGAFNVGGWNSYHIIARGPILIQIMNGQLVSIVIDEDTENAVRRGLIGFQMHTGAPFKIEYKNIYLKKL
ncbi:DUF1080 domain-containing protein [Flagellimonas marinaquae]|nr:DUF1080 domain-containing protein [Allomuricauda aquimarina]